MAKLEHKSFRPAGSAQEQVSQGTENDLRSLIELGRITDSITLDNKTFEMRTMNSSEKLHLSKILGENYTQEDMFTFNITLLSSVIKSVNGQPLETFHPDYNPQGDVALNKKLRFDILSILQSTVIDRLLLFYDELRKRGEEKYGVEQVKN